MVLQNCLFFMEYLFGQIIYKKADELDPDCNCNMCYTFNSIKYFTEQRLKESVTYSKNV
jgi:hypothetical protein